MGSSRSSSVGWSSEVSSSQGTVGCVNVLFVFNRRSKVVEGGNIIFKLHAQMTRLHDRFVGLSGLIFSVVRIFQVSTKRSWAYNLYPYTSHRMELHLCLFLLTGTYCQQREVEAITEGIDEDEGKHWPSAEIVTTGLHSAPY